MVVFSDLFQFLSNACAVHRESVRLGLSFKLGIEIGQSTVHEQMRSSPDSQKGGLSPLRPVAQVNAPWSGRNLRLDYQPWSAFHSSSLD
jgi:hypothetical protein